MVDVNVPTFNRTSMESKRGYEYHDYEYLRITFNRTSMESKLTLPEATGGTGELLIEPVWNRNVSHEIADLVGVTFNRTSMESKHMSSMRSSSDRGFGAFNRTSMESKLGTGYAAMRGFQTFNRTSMESKLISFLSRLSRFSLLIEPVWNRNGGNSL